MRKPAQRILFEEDYLVRTLGNIATAPEVAITELVANAWDAGASLVEITIPNENGILSVKDDGAGMTYGQFLQRWMTLGYNRAKHQGREAEFPPERKSWRRQAFGRNGMGRHGLLCFADQYAVETCREGNGSRFEITSTSGRDPFTVKDAAHFSCERHGTRLSTEVQRKLPTEKRIRDILSARFLHDPQFEVKLNGRSVPLTKHVGLLDKKTITLRSGVVLEIFFFKLQSTARARKMRHHGIAFWVGNRLVGTPSWILGERVMLDGRTRLAKSHTFIVKSDDLHDEVISDWTGFKASELVNIVFQAVASHVEQRLRKASTERLQETKEEVLREHREEIVSLKPSARIELEEFIEELAFKAPTLQQEAFSAAVKAAIHIEKTRSGSALLEKLAKLTEEDIEGLDRLLSEWSVRDALTVLDEIDRRISVVEALTKLSKDKNVDELRTLHPLVTEARWLFGPEFDSPEYTSNVTLRTAAEEIFGQQVEKKAFINYRKRPDIVVLADSTLSIVGTEEFDQHSRLVRTNHILIIELKRGRSRIEREHMNQASDYVEDFLGCGVIDGTPLIACFLVGHKVNSKLQVIRKVGDPELGRIHACTYGQLDRTAKKRLFRLRERLTERYEELSGTTLLNKVLAEPQQLSLNVN